MKNAIVTGANGFLGSNLVKELCKNGVYVYAVVRDEEKCDNITKGHGLSIIQCEMSKYKDIPKLIGKRDIDVFYHFAWDGTSGPKRGDYNIQLKNIENTCEAIKTAEKIGVKKFVLAGSVIEYEYLKCVDKNIMNLDINNMYGLCKYTARNMGKILSDNIHIDFIDTTISNIYGPGERSPRLLNTTLRNMLNGKETYFTECEQLYDFIYIEDAVKAYYYVGLYGKRHGNYYIGNKSPRKLKDFINEMKIYTKYNLELGFGHIKFNGISLNYDEFNTKNLYDELGFNINHSFGDGVNRTISWLKSLEGE